MIAKLRKRHLMIWSGLAVLLPLGMVAALLAIKERPADPYQLPLSEALPQIVASVQHESMLVNLRADRGNSEYQIEVVVLQPLATPSPSLFYDAGTEKPPQEKHLIGALGPTGLYRFPVWSDHAEGELHLVVFDVIKKRPLYRWQLKGGQHGG